MTDTMIDASRGGRPKGATDKAPRRSSSGRVRPEKIFEAAAKAGRNVRMKVDKDGNYTLVMEQPGDSPDDKEGERPWGILKELAEK
jgi:hypothetical protein